MRIALRTVVFAILGVAAAALVPGPAAGQSASPVTSDSRPRLSGTVVDVARDQGSLMLEELAAARGPEPNAVRRAVVLAPDTSVNLVRRAGEVTAGEPPWVITAMKLEDLRPGDFVTVTTRAGDGGRPVAVTVDVVRPAAP